MFVRVRKLLPRSNKRLFALYAAALLTTLGVSALTMMFNNQALGAYLFSHPNTLPSSVAITNDQVGLRFTLTLNQTSLARGEPAAVFIDEHNMLSMPNLVNASSNWRVKAEFSPCGSLLGVANPPLGFAIFQGYYSATNLWMANRLTLYSPGPYFCTLTRPGMSSYLFAPNNDSVAFYGPCNANPCFTAPMKLEEGFRGSWLIIPVFSSSGSFQAFAPGVYTVAGMDEWGDLAILHFAVS